MSLLRNMMEECTIVNKVKVSDGEGGFTTEWQDGASIMAAITHDTSMTARIAEKEGVSSVFTITTDKSVPLDFHDVIRRERDGRIFRVTSDSGDKVTPTQSALDIAQVTAEKWELTK